MRWSKRWIQRRLSRHFESWPNCKFLLGRPRPPGTLWIGTQDMAGASKGQKLFEEHVTRMITAKVL